MTFSTSSRTLLLAMFGLSILSCDNDNQPVGSGPDPDPTSSSEWVTRTALGVPDPDLFTVYWNENGSSYEAGGDTDITMGSTDGTEWFLNSSGGWGRVVGFARVGDGLLVVNSTGRMDCEECADGRYGQYGGSFSAVAASDQLALAVGTQGLVVAHDGTSQTEYDTSVNADFTDVAWDRDSHTFIAAASDGVLRRSVNGSTWNAFSDTHAGRIRSIAVHGLTIVIIGENGELLQSSDRGGNWKSPGQTGLRDVTWAGSSFMAVGDHGKVIFSLDILGWRTVSTGIDKTLYAATSGSKLVAVGEAGTILVSANGNSWQKRQPGRWLYFNDIIWTGTTFVAGASGDKEAFLSPDGIDWTPVNSIEDNEGIWGLEYLAWSGTRAVASATTSGSEGIPQHTRIYASDNLLDWRIVKVTYGSYYGHTVVWMNDEFFVVCSHEIFRSPDGENWTLAPAEYSELSTFRSVTARDGVAYAINQNGRLFISNDLDHWNSVGVVSVPGIKTDIHWTGKELLVCGYNATNRAGWSADGVTWHAMNPNTEFELWGVAASPERWVVVGWNGTIRTREIQP